MCEHGYQQMLEDSIRSLGAGNRTELWSSARVVPTLSLRAISLAHLPHGHLEKVFLFQTHVQSQRGMNVYPFYPFVSSSTGERTVHIVLQLASAFLLTPGLGGLHNPRLAKLPIFSVCLFLCFLKDFICLLCI